MLSLSISFTFVLLSFSFFSQLSCCDVTCSLCSVLLVEQQSEVKRPSVAMPPRRPKIKCLRDSVAWLLLFHTVRSQPLPLSLSLSSLSLLSHNQSVARLFAACAKGPKARKLHVSCVTRKSNLVALACGYEKVEIVLGPGNCLAGNLELIRMDVAAQ
ncbi:hypothetical protein J3E68DRAFT_420570 [Trichoderma sp. SZMC 28012]